MWWKQVNDENPQCTVTLRPYINLDQPHFKWSVVITDWIVSAQNLCVETPTLYVIAFGERAVEKFSSVSQSCLTLWPHGLQHARLPCPSPIPRACSNSCPSSQWCYPTLSSSVVPFSLPSAFPSIRVFSSESVLRIRWPKYWSFSFSISPSNEYSVLISIRMHWLDLLAVQGTLKSLLQHHSSKVSILQCSAFFMVQLSHPLTYMTTGKTIALTRQTFVSKVMSLLFNMLSRLVIAFLTRTKRLLISWLQSPPAVILEPPKIKSVTVSTVSLSICYEVMGPNAMILVSECWVLMLSFNVEF